MFFYCLFLVTLVEFVSCRACGVCFLSSLWSLFLVALVEYVFCHAYVVLLLVSCYIAA